MRFLFDVFRLSSCPHEATSLTYTTVRATRAGLFETVRLSSTCWVRSHSARRGLAVFIGFESCLPERCRRQTQTNPLLGSLPAAPAPPAARGDAPTRHRRTGTRVWNRVSQNERRARPAPKFLS